MATHFYCFETIPEELPRVYVIVPPKQIDSELVFEEVIDEETGETTQVPVIDEVTGEQLKSPVFESVVHINTIEPVKGWESNACNPQTPRMIFG